MPDDDDSIRNDDEAHGLYGAPPVRGANHVRRVETVTCRPPPPRPLDDRGGIDEHAVEIEENRVAREHDGKMHEGPLNREALRVMSCCA